MHTITEKPSKAITKFPAAREINRLHSEIMSAAKTSLEKAIQIGELLTAKKQSMKHGEWLPWIKERLSFSARTVQNYLRCWERRADLKNASVAFLADAYRLLTPPKNEQQPQRVLSYPLEAWETAVEIIGLVTPVYEERNGVNVTDEQLGTALLLLLEQSQASPRLRVTDAGQVECLRDGEWQSFNLASDAELLAA